jgi:hypothetical protein
MSSRKCAILSHELAEQIRDRTREDMQRSVRKGNGAVKLTSWVAGLAARALPSGKVKLAASVETEIRASRRLSGGPGAEVGGMEELREFFKKDI